MSDFTEEQIDKISKALTMAMVGFLGLEGVEMSKKEIKETFNGFKNDIINSDSINKTVQLYDKILSEKENRR